jgi:putative ABC transport system permease protein
MAVGADSSGILKLIFGHGLKLSIAGLVIGVATTLALSRVLSSQLFEISAHDPWALGTVSLLMLAVTAGACYLPARRATRVDPITSLRSE